MKQAAAPRPQGTPGNPLLTGRNNAIGSFRIIHPLLLVALLLAGCSGIPLFDGKETGSTDEETTGSGQEIPGRENETGGQPYSVTITGLEESEKLDALIRASSQLLSLKDRTPQTSSGLRRRVEADLERFAKVLRSEGYYANEISYGLRDEFDEESDDDAEVLVEITIERGPAYRLIAYQIFDQAEGEPATAFESRLEDLGLTLGKRAHAPTIATAQNKLTQELRRDGYPFAKVTDRKAYVDHDKKTLSVEVTLDSGRPYNLGQVRFEGVESIDRTYLSNLIAWKAGQRYDERLLDESERKLMASELFQSVTIEPQAEEASGDTLPVLVQVEERPQRTIGFSLQYDSIDGPGAGARWQHRNLFGAGERFTLEANGSLLEQSLTGRLRKPWFLGDDQTLLAEGGFIREDTEAFESKAITSYLGLERTWGEKWTYSFGGSLEFEQSTDARNTQSRNLGLLGVPLSLDYDGSDSLLNPTSGQRLGVLVTPYIATVEESFSFTSTEVFASTYHSLDEEGGYVFALRGRLGSTFGAGVSELPASKRFFAGGGGSVRGYAFQSIGPLDSSNDPLGGKSVAEVNAEFRLRVSDSIGIVPFLDGGMVSDNSVPSTSETFRWGAGLGLRYHTAVGPIRFDFAVPLNGRDSDDAYAFYISLGQAF